MALTKEFIELMDGSFHCKMKVDRGRQLFGSFKLSTESRAS